MSRFRVPDRLAEQILVDAGHLCGYCHTDEYITGSKLSIEHIIPVAAGGSNDRDNLWRSCKECNEYKGAQTYAFDSQSEDFVPLYDPRRQQWIEHFRWSDDGIQIIGMTAIGRATVIALFKPLQTTKCAPALDRCWLAPANRRLSKHGKRTTR